MKDTITITTTDGQSFEFDIPVGVSGNIGKMITFGADLAKQAAHLSVGFCGPAGWASLNSIGEADEDMKARFAKQQREYDDGVLAHADEIRAKREAGASA